MDLSQGSRHEFSHNQFSVSGGNVRVQYGNNHHIPQTAEISWGDISMWIFGSGPIFSQKTFQRSMQRRRTENRTGSWFLDGEEFGKWTKTPSSFLWLHGKSGCGKTMLCSSAIRKLQNLSSTTPNQALMYHFFTVTDRQSQTSEALTRNLVYQLASHNDETRASTITAFKKGGQGAQSADYDQLLSILDNLLKIPSAVFIIIDALDESADKTETCAFLKDLCYHRSAQTRVLVSSNTTQSLESESTLRSLNTEIVYTNSMIISQDIEAHIRSLELGQWNDDQRNKIVRDVTKRSDGSFRWAIGQLTHIRQCDTEEELDNALDLLPENLTETYERILSTITSAANVKSLRTLLCWLLYARRPLRIAELRETVGINMFEKPHFEPKRRLNKRPKILDQCTFLIVADKDSDSEQIFAVDTDKVQLSAGSTWEDNPVLRLDHLSVVQFLVQTEVLSEHARKFAVTKPEGHLLIAQSCLAYILYLDSPAAPPDAAESCPLFDYAVHHWYYHVQQSGDNTGKLARLVEEVLQTNWEIFRLVTYANISTRYNPWQGTRVSTSDREMDVEQDDRLCTVCQRISIQELRKRCGMRHRTYATLVASARECRLCKMIHCALLQFGIARYCESSSESNLSLGASERIAMEVDAEMHQIARNTEISLRMETADPFLFISCYLYFGRLHLYTNPGSPLASIIFGRPVQSDPRPSLANCRHWLQECRENHPQCNKYASSSTFPSRLIEIGEERIRLLKRLDVPEGATCGFATLTWSGGPFNSLLRSPQDEKLSEMVNGIKIEDLTRTFQEVVRVTKALAIRYLWINDLCIVHDDLLGDSIKETPRMADHYANADINIVAGVKDAQTKVLCPRTPPRFQPTRLNGTEDVFIGWLGTDAYNDPRGLRVSQYSDAWKYRSLLNLHPWTSQFTGHACRNLVLQGDEDSTPGAEAMCTMPTSQLYMQCREEIRWENGRRRPRTAESRSDWYDFVEEYSSQDFTFPADRLLAFFNLAHRYSRSSQHNWGEFLSGLWSKELLRGLLWWAEGDRASWSVPHEYVAPSWSWAAVPGRVKHVWPSDVKPLASIQEFDTSSNSSIISRYLVLRGLLVGIAPIKRAWSNWTDDIKVRVLDGNENKVVLRIRYMLDYFDADTTPGALIYGLRVTGRIGLLLMETSEENDNMRRAGLFIVAKPDTLKWTAITGERDVIII